VGFSRLYQPDTTLEELSGLRNIRKELGPTSVPQLVPLPIVAAKYIQSTGVVFKLKLPNGNEALAFTDASYFQRADANNSVMDKVSGSLLMAIPSDLNPKEIDDIKKGSVSKGMKRQTLYYVVGFPDKENDWGRGGKQLMYGNRLLFYLDNTNTVVDWQSLDR